MEICQKVPRRRVESSLNGFIDSYIALFIMYYSQFTDVKAINKCGKYGDNDDQNYYQQKQISTFLAQLW